MKNRNQKIKRLVLFILLGCFIGICSIGATKADAYTTRKQVKNELKTTEKKMKKVKAAYQSEKKEMKKYKQKSKAYYKGTKPILMASIVCRNPLVIYQAGTYYRITNSASSQIWFGRYLGHIRLTDGYSNINGYYCKNATAVISPYTKKETRATVAYKNHLKKYRQLAKKRAKLKKSLSFSVPAKTVWIYVGESKKVNPKNTYYNKIKLTSSNPAVARIDGTTIHGISAGSATITATYSISGKKTTFKAEIRNKKAFELNYSSYYLEIGKKVTLEGKDWDPDREDRDYEIFTWFSSNESVAKVSSTGKVTAVGYGTAVITVSSDKEIGTCNIIVGEAVEPKINFDESEFNYTQEDIGTQKTLHFTSNIPDLEIYENGNIIRIDNIDYQPNIDPHNMVPGSIKITILKSGDEKLYYKSDRNNLNSSKEINISELCIDYSDTSISCWLGGTDRWSDDPDSCLYKSFKKYGNPGTPTSASGFDSSILDCTISENGSLCLTLHKAGKTSVTIQTSTGYSRTFPITVYGVNYYDSEGNFISEGSTITKEYEKSLDSYTEEELKGDIGIECFLPESDESEEMDFIISSTDNGVIELGEYIDGKQYFSVKGEGTVKIYARYDSNYLEYIYIHINQSAPEPDSETE